VCEGNEYEALNLRGGTLVLNLLVPHPCGFCKGGVFRIRSIILPDNDARWRNLAHLVNYLLARSVPPAR
jgi:hypothetical protein